MRSTSELLQIVKRRLDSVVVVKRSMRSGSDGARFSRTLGARSSGNFSAALRSASPRADLVNDLSGVDRSRLLP